MEKLNLLGVFLIGAFLLFGCSQQSSQAQDSGPNEQLSTTPPASNEQVKTPPTTPSPETKPPAATPPDESQKALGMEQVFKYGSVKSYEYKVAAAGQGSVVFKFTISPVTLDGAPAWLQQTDMALSGGLSATTKTWLDKTTYKCLKSTSIVNMAGQTETNNPCPTTGPNAAGAQTPAPKLTYVGKESVTVPAGTFNCDKYSLEKASYWVASNVPVPVKVSSDDGSSTMELVSYS